MGYQPRIAWSPPCRTHRILHALWVPSLLFLVGACSFHQSQDEIVLGATLPLTGAESRAGLFFKNGYRLAIDEANHAGGVMVKNLNRRLKVRLELLDDKSDSTTAVQLAEHLISVERVHALLGTYETKLVLAQSVVPERLNVPYVTGGGAASEIFKRNFRWIFGLLSSVEAMAKTYLDWMAQQQDRGSLPKPLQIALLWENSAHGQDFRSGIQERVKEAPDRFRLVLKEAFELGSKDFTPLLIRVKAAHADVFLSDSHFPDFMLQHRTYLQLQLHHLIVSYGARGSEQAARRALGAGVDYLVSGQWWTPHLPYRNSKLFVEKYRNRFGDVSSFYPGVAYETARTLLAAIEDAGTLDAEAIRTALIRMDRKDAIIPGKRVYFPRANGYQIDNPSVLVQNMPDGTGKIIYPRDAVTGEAVIPRLK